MVSLGTLDELPEAYRQALSDENLMPLWPALRAFLPYDRPGRRTKPMVWSYRKARPLLLQAGDLTPIEKAERRVLILCNPGLGLENAMATPSIYLGLQLIKPGETAPNHKHSPSAIRLVVEGGGGFTVVDGKKLPMEPADLILTPSGLWHEHGHEGSGPVVWLDVLDLPLIYQLEASYCTEGKPQLVSNAPEPSETHYRRAGLLPYASLDKRRGAYPLTRFPWRDVRAALTDLATVTNRGLPVHLAYVNPETGAECLPVLGFSALMLRPGEELKLPRRSASAVLHVVEGMGDAEIDGISLGWEIHDSVAVPTHAEVRVANGSTTKPAYLFVIDDAPLHRKLGIYEVFA